MKRRDRSIRNTITAIFSVCVAIAMTFAFTAPAEASDGSYKISFKAGAHAVFSDGSTSYDITKGYNDTITDEELEAITGEINNGKEEGYYFKEWSPTVNRTVTRRAIYVAQYARIVDEAVYQVNYVNQDGTALATPKVVKTQLGEKVSEAAVSIEGYEPASSVETITIDRANGLEITFIYTGQTNIIDENETVTTPGTVTTTTNETEAAATETAVGTAGATTAAGNAEDAAAQTTPENGETQEAADDGVPLAGGTTDDTMTSKDEDVPLAKGALSHTKAFVAGGIVILLAVTVMVCFYIKRRKKQSEE